MALFHNKYRIESARHPNWDYTNAGAYFITICTENREYYFGEIADDEMVLSNAGMLVNKCWLEIPNHFFNTRLGTHIIMPNHMHGILILDSGDSDNRDSVETLQCNVSTTTNESNDKNELMANISPKPGSVSTIIRSYKSICTKTINLQFPEMNFGWQSRFHDHIIRNNEEYKRIENYIINNPKNWQSDKLK